MDFYNSHVRPRDFWTGSGPLKKKWRQPHTSLSSQLSLTQTKTLAAQLVFSAVQPPRHHPNLHRLFSALTAPCSSSFSRPTRRPAGRSRRSLTCCSASLPFAPKSW
ncbi:hypothetical protein PIB30_003635 [Stylosanthes scabra]|uniref:Uncharacterized protein n=1 Tax=Stylosanthes scabra TaxID=79078 RepID=A0ABU6Y063_9FABA|nr:hypothetical protein [Stylosanthes scabra]